MRRIFLLIVSFNIYVGKEVVIIVSIGKILSSSILFIKADFPELKQPPTPIIFFPNIFG